MRICTTVNLSGTKEAQDGWILSQGCTAISFPTVRTLIRVNVFHQSLHMLFFSDYFLDKFLPSEAGPLPHLMDHGDMAPLVWTTTNALSHGHS